MDIVTEILIPLITGLLGAVSTGFVFTSKFNSRLAVIERTIEDNSFSRHGVDDKLDRIIKAVTVLETQFSNIATALTMANAKVSETAATVQGVNTRLGILEADFKNLRDALAETRERVFREG